MHGLEMVGFSGLLVLGVFIVLDMAINQSCEVHAAESCDYCGRHWPEDAGLYACGACGGGVCAFCMVCEGRVLCQPCYLGEQLGGEK